MKEYFVVTDVHSFYTPMRKALDKKGFDENNPNHIIISCGDLFDRGSEAKEVLDFFYKLCKEERCILILGNHEDLFLDMVLRGSFVKEDESNGTLMTLAQLQTPPMNIVKIKQEFLVASRTYDRRFDELLASSVDYAEFKNHIFVHGWIPLNEKMSGDVYDPRWRENRNKEAWKVARWSNGMEMRNRGFVDPEKTIVCGHWHSSWGYVRKNFDKRLSEYQLKFLEFSDKEYFKPFYDDGIIAFDACTAFTGYCNCLHFSEEEI